MQKGGGGDTYDLACLPELDDVDDLLAKPDGARDEGDEHWEREPVNKVIRQGYKLKNLGRGEER